MALIDLAKDMARKTVVNLRPLAKTTHPGRSSEKMPENMDNLGSRLPKDIDCL